MSLQRSLNPAVAEMASAGQDNLPLTVSRNLHIAALTALDNMKARTSRQLFTGLAHWKINLCSLSGSAQPTSAV
jgi:hypothetical protein